MLGFYFLIVGLSIAAVVGDIIITFKKTKSVATLIAMTAVAVLYAIIIIVQTSWVR